MILAVWGSLSRIFRIILAFKGIFHLDIPLTRNNFSLKFIKIKKKNRGILQFYRVLCVTKRRTDYRSNERFHFGILKKKKIFFFISSCLKLRNELRKASHKCQLFVFCFSYDLHYIHASTKTIVKKKKSSGAGTSMIIIFENVTTSSNVFALEP